MLPENLKVNKSIKAAIAEKGHSVYMPHMSATTFLAAWFAAEALPLTDADNYIAFSREWENGQMQTAKAILDDVAQTSFVSKALALDIVRRIHEYRCVGGKDRTYILLGVVGLKFMDFADIDEEKKTHMMLKAAEHVGNRIKMLSLAKTAEEYAQARNYLMSDMDAEIHKMGYGPRLTNQLVDLSGVMIDHFIRLGRYIDTQDHGLVEEWMRPFINEILEEVLNNRGNLEFVVDFIMGCKKTKPVSENKIGRQYFMMGAL